MTVTELILQLFKHYHSLNSAETQYLIINISFVELHHYLFYIMILFKTVLGIISTVFFYILQFYINVKLYQNYFLQ